MHGLAQLFAAFVIGTFFGIPVLLTVFHVVLLVQKRYVEKWKKLRVTLEALTLFLGSIYSLCYLLLSGVEIRADWQQQLANMQVHTPIATFAWPTLFTLAALGAVGYFMLRLVPLKYMPPLVVVTGIACLYAGTLVSILWCVQIWKGEFWWLALFPVNCVMLALIQVRRLMEQWKAMQEEERRTFRNPFLKACDRRLWNAFFWPAAALVLFLPIFGIIVGILVLFGQRPDDIITAFTQTSDWNLSTKISPQNIYYDEHYLCTVAAGGHRRLVKPLRMGVRHGHSVVVNRQLCVANAFEQILEERAPRIHRGIRGFYDTYGFPVARKIRSPYTADMVYLLMKPLEWAFLAVIYFCDAKPENRIAVQYLPPLQDKKGEE